MPNVNENEVKQLRLIAGNVNGAAGAQGQVIVEGKIADALVSALNFSEDSLLRRGLRGQPVKVFRSNHLELWVNGFYSEGSGVREIVDRALTALGFTGDHPMIQEVLAAEAAIAHQGDIQAATALRSSPAQR